MAAYRTLQDEGVEEYGGSLALLNGQTILVYEVGIFMSREFEAGVRLLARPLRNGGEVGEARWYTSFALPVKRVAARLLGHEDNLSRLFDPPLRVTVKEARSTYTIE